MIYFLRPLLVGIFFGFTMGSLARGLADDKNRNIGSESPKILALESQIKSLTERIETIEGQLKQVKGGGFTLVPTANCDLNTPFDGSYTATELSKASATQAVIEKCKEKAANKQECSPSRVVCK